MEKQWKQWQTFFSWLQNHCRWWMQRAMKGYLFLGRKAMTNLDSTQRASLIAQLVKNLPEMQQFNTWFGKTCWRRDRLPTPVFLGFLWGWAGKEAAWKVGDMDSIPGLGRSPGEGKGYPLQYSDQENSMDCIDTKSQTQLSDLHFLFRQHIKKTETY